MPNSVAASAAREHCVFPEGSVNPDVAKWVGLCEAWLRKHMQGA